MKPMFFGVRGQIGHYWHRPNGGWVISADEPVIRGIDGGWSPRRWKKDRVINRHLVPDPQKCWIAQLAKREDRQQVQSDTEEWPQGSFLLHRFENPTITMISWWDRCQGDVRFACNSNFVLIDDAPWGTHAEPSAGKMIAELVDAFPQVYANLERAGVKLVEAL